MKFDDLSNSLSFSSSSSSYQSEHLSSTGSYDVSGQQMASYSQYDLNNSRDHWTYNHTARHSPMGAVQNQYYTNGYVIDSPLNTSPCVVTASYYNSIPIQNHSSPSVYYQNHQYNVNNFMQRQQYNDYTYSYQPYEQHQQQPQQPLSSSVYASPTLSSTTGSASSPDSANGSFVIANNVSYHSPIVNTESLPNPTATKKAKSLQKSNKKSCGIAVTPSTQTNIPLTVSIKRIKICLQTHEQ
jgi:hypothetical protein